jgi:hypothetical protein
MPAVSCDILGKKLRDDEAAKFDVLSLIDHSHPAAAQLLDDAVVRDNLPDYWREYYGGRMGINESRGIAI